jgi:hypothetical protein
MARKKAKNRDPLLTHSIRTRVRAVVFQRLQNLVKTNDCQSLAELTRRILSREKIICYHRDTSLDEPLEELIRIRKELNAIGVNINQITHSFHTSDTPGKQVFHSLKIAEEYKKVGEKVDFLSKMIFELGQKWLQK